MRETLIKDNRGKQIVFKHLIKPKHQANNLSVLLDQVKLSNNKIFSVEVCPNRSLDTESLQELSPAFCSVTWHSPSDDNLKNVPTIPAITLCKQLSIHGHHVLLHLVGRHLSKLQAKLIFDELQQIRVRNVFVLQGEPCPESKDKNDFHYASDLVEFIRLNYGNYFCIGGAAYAQMHPNSENKVRDLRFLKIKVEMGIDFLITQMLFDADTFVNFCMECKTFGINVPIIPGIYIISSYRSLLSMAKFCKVQVPSDILKVLTANKENAEAIRNYGIFQSSRLIKQIFLKMDKSVIDVHFFSLNNIKLVKKVCKVLGLCDWDIERPLIYRND